MANTAGSQGDGTPEHQPELADVSSLPLAELIPADDTVLANSLRRLLAELDSPQEIIAAHNNFADDPRRD
jgi:FXSXX-COOH protein